MPQIIVPKRLPEGVPASSVEAIKRLIRSRRQVFGVPGASLTWGIEGSSSSDVGAGIEGEKMTAKILNAWVTKHPSALVFHSVLWPGVEGDTDHIVVVGNHLLLIDSKRWKSKRKYSVTASGSILRGTVAFPEGNVKMVPALKAWRQVLESKVARVSGVVCVAQDEVFVPYDENWRKAPYKLVTAEKLEEYLDRFVERDVAQRNKDVIDLATVSTVAVRLVKPRDRRSEFINTKAFKK